MRLISLSIAPARDTPQRLNDYACPNPAWLWRTGDRESVSTALLSGKEQAMQPQREEPSRGPGRGRASRKEQ